MPKPKPKTASPTFTAHTFSLSPKVVDRLLTSLGHPGADLRKEAIEHQLPGYEIASALEGAPVMLVKSDKPSQVPSDFGQVILNVEAALGLYVNAREHLDEIPGPADYREVFLSLQKSAFSMLTSLTSMGGYYFDQFAAKGANLYDIEKALLETLRVAEEVLKDVEGKQTRGGPKNRALNHTIARLIWSFDNAPKGGSASNQFEFVKAAILAARILTIKPATADCPEADRVREFDKALKHLIRQVTRDKGPQAIAEQILRN